MPSKVEKKNRIALVASAEKTKAGGPALIAKDKEDSATPISSMACSTTSTKPETAKTLKKKGEKKRKRSTSPSSSSKAPSSKKSLIKNESADKSITKNQSTDKSIIELSDTPTLDSSLAFSSFDISKSTISCLESGGITALFPIQAATFNLIMSGKDLLGRARTGCGKTLAFALPMVETLKKLQLNDPSIFRKHGRSPQVLVMAPTRELATQVAKVFSSIVSLNFKVATIYGGVSITDQYHLLKEGLDIVVGTPGRLIDHIDRGNLKLDNLRFICMDEADQMLDIGFAESMDCILQHVIKQNVENPVKHQTLLFSATIPDWVKGCIGKYMNADRVTIDLIGSSKSKVSETVKHLIVASRWQNRSTVLGDIVSVYARNGAGRTIIFVETKNEANELAMHDKLKDSQVIHGDIVQKQREVSMQGFRDGKFSTLIATNVCARGVDIPEVDLVVNCEPPSEVETYIHRSGRTGRAGRAGTTVTFYKPQQEVLLQAITKRAGVNFVRIGAPQPEDIIKSRATDTVETIKSEVHPKVFKYFIQTSADILDSFQGDAIKAISACLALICDTIKPIPPRSLLSANEGFLTLFFKLSHKIHSQAYVRNIIQRQYPNIKYDDTAAWRMCADDQGVVADFKSDLISVEENDDGSSTLFICGSEWIPEDGVQCELAREIPELKELPGSSFAGRGRGSRGSRGSSGRGGSARASSAARGGRGRASTRGNPFDQASKYKR